MEGKTPRKQDNPQTTGAVSVGGTLSRANPRISTVLHVGAGQYSDKPTPVQLLNDAFGIIDIASADGVTQSLLDRVDVQIKWLTQDLAWRRSPGFHAATFPSLVKKWSELRSVLHQQMNGKDSSAGKVLTELNAILRVLMLEAAVDECAVNLPRSWEARKWSSLSRTEKRVLIIREANKVRSASARQNGVLGLARRVAATFNPPAKAGTVLSWINRNKSLHSNVKSIISKPEKRTSSRRK